MMDPYYKYDPDDPNNELFSEHHQCDECGKITKGPGKEERYAPPKYPYKLNHIDENGTGTTYEERPDLPYNVSTGKCPNCIEGFMRNAARDVNWRVTMRDWRKQDELDKTTQRVEESYQNTLDRTEQSYNQTIAENERRYNETIAPKQPPAGEDESTGN